jgi:DNA-binding NarL/FixJ family response regulator
MKIVARLTVLSGGEGLLLMPTGEFKIGRHTDCDLILQHREISRHHATIIIQETSATIIDQGSRNGIRVDRIAVTRSELQHGSSVHIGTTYCRFDWLNCGDYDDDQSTCTPVPRSHTPILTNGEDRVLKLLLGGLSEKAIAVKLELSRHTIHNHVKKIYSSYCVNSRAELLAHFIRQHGSAGT